MNVIFRKCRSLVWRILGIDKINVSLRTEISRNSRLQEEVLTLQYFLNHLNDINTLPVTPNKDLRIMQECDAILLQIFDKVCKKHNLTYWLDWGTLLGSIRHNGFIPWDDDMDVCMPRADYECLLMAMDSESQKLVDGLEYKKDIHNELNPFCCTRIGIGYKHNQTGIWLDVFPMDSIVVDDVDKCSWVRAMDFYSKQGGWNHLYQEGNATRKFVFCPGDSYNTLPWKEEWLYPLTKHEFEGHLFPVPYMYDKWLERIYGNYMSFPKTGVEHHDLGRGALCTWAKRNSVDMNVIKQELSSILDRFD